MLIEYRLIEVGSELHRGEQSLRDEVLRKPLGRALSASDIARDRDGHHFAALADGEVVGCVGLYPQTLGIVRLRQMAVSPYLQGKGIGAAVLTFAEDWARRNDIIRIELHARLTARGFYERLGYTAEGEVFEEIALEHQKMWKAL